MSDISKARVIKKEVAQLHIFNPSPRQLCQKIGLNWLAALRLRDAGWIGFDPEAVKELDLSQQAELGFIGSLVVGGCDEAMLTYLLRGLDKPYSYQIDLIFYDWKNQGWKLLPSLNDLDRERLVHEWLDQLVESEEIEELTNISDKLQEALEEFAEESGEQ